MNHANASNTGAKPPVVDSQAVEVDVRSLVLMLWRRKMVILGVLLIGLSLAIMVMSLVPPRYTARALLLIESTKSAAGLPSDIQALLGSARLDSSLVMSEIEVIRSRTLGRRVVEKLNLMTDPEFNQRFSSAKNTPGAAEPSGAKATFKSFDVYGSELENLSPEMAEQHIGEVVTRFLDGLRVVSIPGSFAIQVEYTSRSPSKAALITNAVIDTYIEQRLEDKFRATKKVADWLDKRLEDLRAQVQSAEQAVQAYKQQHNIVEGTRNVVSAEQLSALNSQLVLAKAQQAEAEARLQQIEELTQGNLNLDIISEYLDSSLVKTLKLDEANLKRELSELSSRYGDRHPEIIKRRSDLRDLQITLRTEILKMAKGASSNVEFARARVQSLEKGLNQIGGQNMEDNEAMIKMRELEREAESSRLIYNTFLGTYKRTDQQEDLQEAEARVVSYATVPRAPSYPNKPLLLSLSALTALFVGLALAVLLEKLDNTFRSAGQLENQIGFPCYGMIPLVEAQNPVQLGNYTIAKPSSTLAESVRTLRMVVNLRAPEGKKPRVLSITSSFPGEGKTTLSVWMAKLAAKSGEKVLLIDCDLRRPTVHRAMGAANDVTLVEYLTGHKELAQVIQKDPNSGLHIIYGRSVPNSALDLVSSARMSALVESLKQAYDLVIMDTPACLAVSDARVLATLSDQILYAVSWDQTPREVVQSGVKQFSDMGYTNTAFVLTNVDIKRHIRYGYGDAIYYYGRYAENSSA